MFFVLRAIEARATGRRVESRWLCGGGSRFLGLATWRYGFDWVRAFGPLARNAESQTSYALPHRLEQLGVPHAAALAIAARRSRRRACLAWAGGVVGAHALGLSACLLLATTPWLAPWYTIWALPLAAAEDDRRAQVIALGFCAYLLPQTIPIYAPEDEHAVLGEDARPARVAPSAASGGRATAPG